MALLALALAVLSAAPPRFDPPKKLDAPKLDLKLPPLPSAEGLSGPAPAEGLQARQAASDLRTAARPAGAKVVGVVHAQDFARAEGGYRPVSRFEALVVPGLPARIAPFKTCLSLTSGERLPVVVRASLRSPTGEALLTSRAEVSFGARQAMDLVIDWDGFRAVRAGDLKVQVTLDGAPAGEYALPIQVSK